MEANQQTSTPVNQKQENTQNNKKEEKPLCPSLRLKNYLYYFFGGSAALMISFFIHRRFQKN